MLLFISHDYLSASKVILQLFSSLQGQCAHLVSTHTNSCLL